MDFKSSEVEKENLRKRRTGKTQEGLCPICISHFGVMYTSLHSWFANLCFCASPFPQITLLTIENGTVSVISRASRQTLQNSTDGFARVSLSIPLPTPIRKA